MSWTLHTGPHEVVTGEWTLHVDRIPDARMLALVVDAMRRADLTPEFVCAVTLHLDEGDLPPRIDIDHFARPTLERRTTTLPIHWPDA